MSKYHCPVGLASILSAAILLFAAAAVGAQTGELSVEGDVSVNGKSAVSGTKISSGWTIKTGKNSGAVISIPKRGRVEALPGATFKLVFRESEIAVALTAGGVRVAVPAGTIATVETNEAAVKNDDAAREPVVFTVQAECGRTRVSTQTGVVFATSAGATSTVAPGSTESIGTPCKK
jgi:hypothetical protein